MRAWEPQDESGGVGRRGGAPFPSSSHKSRQGAWPLLALSFPRTSAWESANGWERGLRADLRAGGRGSEAGAGQASMQISGRSEGPGLGAHVQPLLGENSGEAGSWPRGEGAVGRGYGEAHGDVSSVAQRVPSASLALLMFSCHQSRCVGSLTLGAWGWVLTP